MLFLDILKNPVLVTSAIAWITSQLIKAFIDLRAHRKIRIFGNGGMPSSHSATVMSLALMTGLYSGFASAQFGIAFMLAFIVMSDAAGVRRETAKHSASIKDLASIVNGIRPEDEDEVNTDKLAEFVGHTPLQVIFGALLGIIVAVAYYFIAKYAVGITFAY